MSIILKLIRIGLFVKTLVVNFSISVTSIVLQKERPQPRHWSCGLGFDSLSGVIIMSHDLTPLIDRYIQIFSSPSPHPKIFLFTGRTERPHPYNPDPFTVFGYTDLPDGFPVVEFPLESLVPHQLFGISKHTFEVRTAELIGLLGGVGTLPHAYPVHLAGTDRACHHIRIWAVVDLVWVIGQHFRDPGFRLTGSWTSPCCLNRLIRFWTCPQLRQRYLTFFLTWKVSRGWRV